MIPDLPGFATYPKAGRYWAIVEHEATVRGVPIEVVFGVMAAESGFNERAYRNEPHINDASRGLMQLLYRTARALGHAGSAEDLYDPAVNIALGTQYLADGLTVHNGDVWAAVSRYNNGHGRVATRATKVCLWRNPDKSCAQYFTAQKGQFLNQPYVDKVRRYAALFAPGGGATQAGIGPLVVLAIAIPVVRKLFT